MPFRTPPTEIASLRMVLHTVAVVLCLVPAAVAGEISTVAGTGSAKLGLSEGKASEVNLGQPFGVEVAADGGIFITEVENHRVLRLDPKTQQVKVVAGNGTKGRSGDGGLAVKAAMWEPYEVRLDAKGNLFVVEMKNAVIRKVDAESGTITTIAGTGEVGFGGDGGPAVEAKFNQPHSIALDGRGGLYVADIINHRIRRIDLESGKIETVCGNGKPELPKVGALAVEQPIRGPRALFVTGRTLWIALREGNSVWKIDLETGRIHPVAGTGKVGMQDGPAAEATFNGPKGIAVGAHDDLYVMDTENQAVRKIDAKAGTVSTIAGGGPKTKGFGGDGGPALSGRMDRPHGIAVDPAGNVYIGDTNNHRVRKVTP